jgi:putative membrane protein
MYSVQIFYSITQTMKTMKVIPHLLVGSALVFSAACSSSNTGMSSSSGSTSGSSTGTSTSMDASGSGASGGSASGATMGTGSITPGSTMGSTGTAGTSGMAGSGTAAAADMTAFMATFATMPDPTFLMTAASSNLLEIQMGQMAAQKSANADVKRFGQMMVDHHTKATQQLQTVAAPLGVTLPQTMMPVHQAMADRLTSKSGKAFDEDYMDAMEVAHKMDIAMFEAKSGTAQAPAVKSFAAKTLPMLRSHHTMANEIEKKVD